MGRVTDRLARTSPRTRAAVMSFILPGLGQAYLGRIGRAVIWIIGIIAVGTSLNTRAVEPWVTAAFGLALSTFAAVDAAVVAPARGEPNGSPPGA